MKSWFIGITKSSLKRNLKELDIANKYHDDICDGIKCIFEDSLKDIILSAIESQRIIEGEESLEKH